MENRFKFRAWSKKDNKFIKSNYITLNQDGILIETFNYDSELMIKDVTDDFIIMQSTGLTDKNGKEIFEGDIVKHTCDSNTSDTQIIEWSNGGFGVKGAIFKLGLEKYNKQLVILGNIYENKELIGE